MKSADLKRRKNLFKGDGKADFSKAHKELKEERKDELLKEGIKDLKRQMKEPVFPIYATTQEIKKRFIFKSTWEDEVIHVYQEGIYVPEGRKVILNFLEKWFGQEISTHNKNEIIAKIRDSTLISVDDFNKDKNLIHFQNGILDLKTKKMLKFDPEILATIKLPVIYKKSAKMNKINKFLEEILMPEDIPLIQEITGYCLLKHYRYQKSFMFLGSGGNGKGTLLSLMSEFLGTENVSNVELADLQNRRFTTGKLYGKLANISGDLPQTELKKTGKFKQLCGGDRLFADEKNKSGFHFLNHAKMIFSCNKLPASSDDTIAFWRRWIIINFPFQFSEDIADPNKIDKLTTEEELSGFLNWALKGLARLEKNGRFSHSKTTEETREFYILSSNPLQAFVEKEVEVDIEGYIPKADFYEEYIKFCKKLNAIPESKNIVGRDIGRYIGSVRGGRVSITGKQTEVWKGIKLISGDSGDSCDLHYPHLRNDIYIVKEEGVKRPLSPLSPLPQKTPKIDDFNAEIEEEEVK